MRWRDGIKGPLRASFAAIRVRPAYNHGPGEEMWVICEKRAGGERQYYLSNYPADTDLDKLAAVIKARWSCKQEVA